MILGDRRMPRGYFLKSVLLRSALGLLSWVSWRKGRGVVRMGLATYM